MAVDENGCEYGPTQGELETVFGAAAFAALQAFLEAHGLSIVRLPQPSERKS